MCFEGKQLLFQESSELLFLAGLTNPLPNIYWNTAAWHYYRREGETIDETASRLIRSARPDAFVRSRIVPLSEDLRRIYAPLTFTAPNDRYRAVFHVRREVQRQ